MSLYRWKIKDVADESLSRLHAALPKVHPAIIRSLAARGVDSFEKSKKYFKPELDELHDPFLMKGMKEAISRIEQAIQRKEKVLIYGDYDVDGTSSVALVYTFFQDYFAETAFYIPDRYSEGYGVSKKGILYAVENGFTLIITLDCGIKAVSLVAEAKTLGVDFIICDHHIPGERLPAALAILDAKQKDCDYPYKELSACGVGFKLIQAFSLQKNENIEKAYQLLDLVCLSIAADIVPITGENRVLAYYGLQKLNENPLPGIQAIIELTASTKPLQIDDVVFKIAPRINAAGRIDHAKNAVNLLLGNDVHLYSKKINQDNEDRRGIDRNTSEEALEMILHDENFLQKSTTVLYDENWHKGVLGIVASRLIETHYRPTVILTRSDDGLLSGSARSVKGVDLYEVLSKCETLLEKYGGHTFAAGLSLKPENLPAFSEMFDQEVKKTTKGEELIPEIEIDAELDLNDINFNFYNTLERMSPFGPGNMRPIFLSRNMGSNATTRIVGENHLQLSIRTATGFIKGIAFKMADKITCFEKPVDLCYTLDMNHYNAKKSIQLIIKDIKPSVI